MREWHRKMPGKCHHLFALLRPAAKEIPSCVFVLSCDGWSSPEAGAGNIPLASQTGLHPSGKQTYRFWGTLRLLLLTFVNITSGEGPVAWRRPWRITKHLCHVSIYLDTCVKQTTNICVAWVHVTCLTEHAVTLFIVTFLWTQTSVRGFP